MKKIFFILLITFVFAFPGFSQTSQGDIFNINKLHEIRITFQENNFWQILKENAKVTSWGAKKKDMVIAYNQQQIVGTPGDDDDIPYLKGSVNIDGYTLSQTGVRLKGFSSLFSSNEYKKSLKLDFDAYNDTVNYFGIKKLNLNNGVGDPSFQRDAISYNLLRKAGIAAPRTSYAKVYINNKYWGLYVIVEQIDKVFLKNNFASSKGNLYKNIGWNTLTYIDDNFDSYKESIELRTNESNPNTKDYVNLLKVISQSANFKDSIQKYFYVDYYLKILAWDVISKNWDSFIQHGRNFYLYHEPVSDLFYWIPWDYNLSMTGALFFMPQQKDTCPKYLDFFYEVDETTVTLHADTSKHLYQNYSWFYYEATPWSAKANQEMIDSTITPVNGDLTTTHKFLKKGVYPVTLSAWDMTGCSSSITKNVALIDTTNICKSILRKKTPYIPDETYDKVFKKDNFCCDCSWDNNCDILYNNISIGSVYDDYSYPIEYNSDKLLLQKILSETSFHNRYLDIFKYMLDSIYIVDYVAAFVKNNTDLIREAVYADTNYLFTIDEFESDIKANCVHQGVTTSLSRFTESRRKGLQDEYGTLGHTAQSVERKINYNDIVINEIYASSADADWIEVFNNTSQIANLKGIYLSDESFNPHKWKFPDNVAVKPKGFLIIYADKEDSKKNNLHANFKLSSDGESVFINNSNSELIDKLTFGLQPLLRTFGRIPDGIGNFVKTYPTLNKPNSIINALVMGEYEMNIYPNPASDWVFINLPMYDEYRVTFFDITGKTVLNQSIDGASSNIDLQQLDEGMYFITIQNRSNSFKANTKLVICK